MRNAVLSLLHTEHPGASRMKMLARSLLWWPGLDAEIENTVKTCSICQQMQNSAPRSPLEPWPVPARCWQRVHVDFFDFEKTTFLLCVDSFSKWIEVFPMRSTTAAKTIERLRSLFAAYGYPEQLVSDNGPQFSAQEFQDFLDACGIRRTYSPPYHPQSNGAAERSVQTVKRSLRKQLLHDNKGGNNRSMRERLDDFLLAYRTTPNTATGKCPAELFLKRTPRTKLSLLRPSFRDDMQSRQEGLKQQHDQRRSTFRSFKEGDWVYVKTVRQEKVSWTEGRIVRLVSPVTYLVETQNTVRYVHVDHLRSRSSFQYAGLDTGAEAPRRPDTDDLERHQETLPSPPQEAQHDADASVPPLRDDAPTPTPPPQDGQELQLPAAHNAHPEAQAEAPSDSPPTTLRRSQRARKPPDRYTSHDFRHCS